MSAHYTPTGTSGQIASTWIMYTTGTTATSATVTSTGWSSTSTQTVAVYPAGGTISSAKTYQIPDVPKNLQPGVDYNLPDGSVLRIDWQGNYTIEDKDAKVTYRASRIREFNPYLNASDLLEDFIRDMHKEGVLQSELLQLPVNIFIHWLILQAALKDGDPVDDVTPPVKLLPAPKKRCLCCGRFLPKVKLAANLLFCDGSHFDRYQVRSLMNVCR